MTRTQKLDGYPLSEYCDPAAARQVLELRKRPLKCENCSRWLLQQVVLEDETIFYQCTACGHVNDPC